MILRLLSLGICFVCLSAFPSVSDSMRVKSLLDGISTLSPDQNIIIKLAKGFQGTPYAGGTLEAFPSERLVVRLDSVDCTTFVEYVLALAVTHDTGAGWDSTTYSRFKQNLQQIRYRNGMVSGYSSRLHYFTDWIADNDKKGLVKEVTVHSPYAVRKVSLDFMTTHAQLYPALAKSEPMVNLMKQIENRWANYEMPYIPKAKLDLGKQKLKIHDGDILAIVTNIRGLDVVHVGFAYWMDGKLHLIHASSQAKKVIIDSRSLYDYSFHKKSHLGIRVIRCFYSGN